MNEDERKRENDKCEKKQTMKMRNKEIVNQRKTKGKKAKGKRRVGNLAKEILAIMTREMGEEEEEKSTIKRKRKSIKAKIDKDIRNMKITKDDESQ